MLLFITYKLLRADNKGLIMKSTKDLVSIDCYVDTNFAGLCGVEDNKNPMSANPCTRYYVLLLTDCPLLMGQ